jgi:hypothetical protein
MNREYTYDTQFLLMKQDLKTERLLAEVEEIVLRNANFEAHIAAKEDKDEL